MCVFLHIQHTHSHTRSAIHLIAVFTSSMYSHIHYIKIIPIKEVAEAASKDDHDDDDDGDWLNGNLYRFG